jgi:hypothetical protein
LLTISAPAFAVLLYDNILYHMVSGRGMRRKKIAPFFLIVADRDSLLSSGPTLESFGFSNPETTPTNFHHLRDGTPFRVELD